MVVTSEAQGISQSHEAVRSEGVYVGEIPKATSGPQVRFSRVLIYTNDFLASPQSSERIFPHPVYMRNSPQYIQYEHCVDVHRKQ